MSSEVMNSTLEDTTRLSSSTEYASGIVLLFVQACGSLGNLLVIFSIFTQRRLLKSNYYYLVLNLAICDLLSLLKTLELIYSGWFPESSFIRSNVMCKLWNPSFTLFFTAGVHFMVLIAVFRYRAVVHPLKPAVSRWKLKVIAGLEYTVIFVLVCLIPMLFMFNFENSKCVHKWPNPDIAIAFSLFETLIQFYTPVAILAILYYKISQTLSKQHKRLLSFDSKQTAFTADHSDKQTYLRRLRHHRNVRTFYVSVAIVVCFALTATPLHTWWLLLMSDSIEYENKHERWVLAIYLTGTCSLNPFIYGIWDKTLLTAYKRNWEKVKLVFRRATKTVNGHDSINRITSLETEQLSTSGITH